MRAQARDCRLRVVRNLVKSPAGMSSYWSTNSVTTDATMAADTSVYPPGSDQSIRVDVFTDVGGVGQLGTWNATAAAMSPVVAGRTYVASCLVRAAAGLPFYMRIRWRRADLSETASVEGASSPYGPDWARISLTAVCPVDAAYAMVVVAPQVRVPVGGSWWVAQPMLTEGPALYPYGDGNRPNWAWDGAQNMSTSRGWVFTP